MIGSIGKLKTPVKNNRQLLVKNHIWQLWLFLISLSIGLAAFCAIHFFPINRVPLFYIGFIISFFSMLGLRHYWPSQWNSIHVLLVAIIARSFLLPLDHSDDLNRYMWEGKCQIHGINPYTLPPKDQCTEKFRDCFWQDVNHKEFTTIYGPLAEVIFRVCASVWYSPLFFKIIILLFDLGTLFLLILFLKTRGSRLNEALLYAVNPLVFYSFAAEGHAESIMLCMLAGALLLHQKKKYSWVFALIGCAASVKLTALMFLPLFIRKETLRSRAIRNLTSCLFDTFWNHVHLVNLGDGAVWVGISF